MYKLLHVVSRAAIDGNDTCEQTRTSLRATVTLQCATAALLVATALLFVGIGIALYSPTPQLSVQECLSKHLGTTYCTQTMRASGDLTKLWNYGTSGCVCSTVIFSHPQDIAVTLSIDMSTWDGHSCDGHAESHFGLHQARAVCEWVAMFSLVGYSLSFLLYRDHDLDARTHPMDAPLLTV